MKIFFAALLGISVLLISCSHSDALGRSSTVPEPEKKIVIASSAKKSFETEPMKEILSILQAVFTQCDLYPAGMKINRVSTDSAKGIIVDVASGEKFMTTHEFVIPIIHKNQVMVRYNSFSSGYLGKLKKSGNRWLVTRWRLEWLS
jgi:hypothetical protein